MQGMQPRQAMMRPSIYAIQSLPLQEFNEGEWRIILDAYDEHLRSGYLERIYPTVGTVDKYNEYFSTPRYANIVLQKWMQAGGERMFCSCDLAVTRGKHKKGEHPPDQFPPWLPRC